MARNAKGVPPRHTDIVRELMRTRGMGVTEIRWRSMEDGSPISRSTIHRVLMGETPSFRVQVAISRALSTDEAPITPAQIFGSQPLPRWAQDSVYGVAA